MKLQMVVEAKDEIHGLFKAIPDYYIIDGDKIISKLSFNINVNKMLASVDNEDREIDPMIDDSPLGGLRGIPVDSSDIYLDLVKQFKVEGKNHHYYFLKELDNIKRQGYLFKKDKFGITYEELASDFLNFISKLTKLAEDKKICLWCIRLNFFFI